MRIIRFLLFFLLSFSMTCAWADILPLPWQKRHPRPPIGERPPPTGSEARVSMAAANVEIRIKKMAAAPGAGEKTAGLLAQVTGEFDMVCAAAPQESKDLDLALPIGYEDEKPPAPVRFAVAIDGKPAAAVKTTTWPVTDENGRPRIQWGYAWRLAGLKGGQKRRIVVEYSMVLPQNEGKANFIYFLRSGALWDGPVGQEIVKVMADQGLRLEVLSPTALKPETRTDTLLTWRITNAKPAEDIRLTIVAGVKL